MNFAFSGFTLCSAPFSMLNCVPVFSVIYLNSIMFIDDLNQMAVSP